MLQKIFIIRCINENVISFIKEQAKGKTAVIFGPGGSERLCVDLKETQTAVQTLSDETKVPSMLLAECMGDDSWLGKYHIPLWRFISEKAVYGKFDIVVIVIPPSQASIIHKGINHFTRKDVWISSEKEWELFKEDSLEEVAFLDLSTSFVIPHHITLEVKEKKKDETTSVKRKKLRIAKRAVPLQKAS